MAKFTFFYKTSDGVRHEAEITAPSKDEAFARLRKEGIRPIKVVQHEPPLIIKVFKRSWVVLFVVGCIVSYEFMTKEVRHEVASETEKTAYVAKPMARRWLTGNRQRIETAKSELFDSELEGYLAQFTEPGVIGQKGSLSNSKATEYFKVLNTFIYVSDDSFTEENAIKRIVAGLKREMKDYLDGGGTPSDYAKALMDRQTQEWQLRESATKKLSEMEMNEKAYSFWLKVNASLAAMGIQPIELPNELYAFQMSLDLNAE